MSVGFTAMVLLLASVGADRSGPPPGIRLDLTEARVFVPESYRPTGGTLDLVIHLHGADAIVERALVETGWPAALVVVNRSGLSSAYAKPFADRAFFDRLISRTCQEVSKALSLDAPLRPGRSVVSSFSAGFGGVRAILGDEAHFQRINGLILADSLYCGYEEPAEKRQPDPTLMEGFRRFAREAAAGRKVMLVSHSAQVPEGYASTTETADDLLRAVGATAKEGRRDWGEGWTETRRLERGGLVVVGFDGKEAADHLRHLRRIAALWKALPNPFETRPSLSLEISRRDTAIDADAIQEAPESWGGRVHDGRAEICADLEGIAGRLQGGGDSAASDDAIVDL